MRRSGVRFSSRAPESPGERSFLGCRPRVDPSGVPYSLFQRRALTGQTDGYLGGGGRIRDGLSRSVLGTRTRKATVAAPIKPAVVTNTASRPEAMTPGGTVVTTPRVPGAALGMMELASPGAAS
jgi:hypothetical protein